MKRKFTILLIIMICLVVSGCGKKKVTEKDATSVKTDKFVYEFKTDNAAYAISYLGKSEKEVIELLGEASEIKKFDNYNMLDYGIFKLYISDKDGVFQIEDLNVINPINGFSSKLTYERLKEECSSIGMSVPEIKDNHKDKKDVKYSYNVKVKYDDWIISYTWDSKKDKIDYNKEENTRIVLYKEGLQLWD